MQKSIKRYPLDKDYLLDNLIDFESQAIFKGKQQHFSKKRENGGAALLKKHKSC